MSKPPRLLRALMAAAVALAGCRATAAGQLQVVVYEGGQRRALPVQDASTAALLQAVEDSVHAADAVLRLAVTPQLVETLRNDHGCVEVTYPEPRRFTLPLLQGREVLAQRLLVPLTGELAGTMTTILLDPGSGYRAGPLRASRPTQPLARLAGTGS
ncbi:MAG TPA: hypothetical protein VEC57_06305 [Candidatus Limnocylindrales bacterium]|nr:hypothetical protein [Candidatus Limnocylindrales bacterium]